MLPIPVWVMLADAPTPVWVMRVCARMLPIVILARFVTWLPVSTEYVVTPLSGIGSIVAGISGLSSTSRVYVMSSAEKVHSISSRKTLIVSVFVVLVCVL